MPHSKRLLVATLTALIVLLLALVAYVVGPFAGATSKSLLQTWSFGKPVASLAYSPNGDVVAVGLDDGTIQIRQAANGALLHTLAGHTGKVHVLAFSPDGGTLASGATTPDTSVHLWRVSDGEPLRTLPGHSYEVNALVFSPDGSILASGGFNGEVLLWRAPYNGPDREVQGTMTGSHSSDPIVALAFDGDNRNLITADFTGMVQEWNLQSRRVTLSIANHTTEPGPVLTAFGVGAGKTHTIRNVATGSMDDPDVSVWTLPSGADQAVFRGHRAYVRSLAFSPDGQLIASSSGHTQFTDEEPVRGTPDISVRVWRVADAQEEVELIGHTDDITSVAWSPDGKLLASGSDDGTVRLWQVK